MSNMTNLWLSGAFFSSSKYSQNSFSAGAPPGHPGGAYDAPRSPSRLGRGTPSHHTLPPYPYPSPRRFRRLRRLGCQAPNTNSWLRLWPSWLTVWWASDSRRMSTAYRDHYVRPSWLMIIRYYTALLPARPLLYRLAWCFASFCSISTTAET